MNQLNRILFNTWSAAFFQKGGGEYQLLHSKEAITALGYNVELYNQWSPQPDIDVLHQFSIEPGVEKVIQAYRGLNKKVVTSTIMWNLIPKEHPEFLRVRNIFNLSHYLLTNSDLESKRLSDAFEIPISKFIKTRNAITKHYCLDSNADLFQKKMNLNHDFILCVANIDRRKNIKNLVEAAKSIDIPLYTIGHIKDEQYFQEFKDIFKNYKHLGAIEDIEFLKSAYCACSAFVLPSMCETPSIAALEAAAQGAKIVITKEGSTTEYFKNYVSYCNPTELQSIIQGISNELNSNRDSSLKNYIRETYTWDNTANDIIGVYKSL